MQIYDVFISYRRSDGAAIAKELYDHLTAKGLRVFYDLDKMEDGHYFTTQIEKNLRKAPNYILIASTDVFRFRDGEDWVRREIEIALDEYDRSPSERTITVLTPTDAYFPEKQDLPTGVRSIADVQRIPMHSQWHKKVLQAVTKVNRCNLWHSAHRWLENSKKDRGRFARLNVAERILPQAVREPNHELSVFVREGEKSSPERPLMEAIGSGNEHGYLIGEGGIGKTTALIHIMNQAYHNKTYDPHGQIPLFVELSYAPDTYGRLYEDGKSSFIRRSVYKQLREDRSFKQVSAKEVSEIDEVFQLPADVAVHPINTVFSQNTSAPEYLLLLDGLNEVSTVELPETQCSILDMIVWEIRLLMEAFPNVRVLLTSRSDYSPIQDLQLSRYYLTGLQEETVSHYLAQQGIGEETIHEALLNKQLAEILKIPLFLTMYGQLSNKGLANTRGEILKYFFGERRANGQLYTARDRLDKIERNVITAASAAQSQRITAQMQNFILDFILPELAWHMETEGQFYLSGRKMKKIMMPVLQEAGDFSVCGEFGAEVFQEYNDGSAKRTVKTVADKFLKQFGEDTVVEGILDCCVLSLGILQESNHSYGFIHQHIRDYFAALKYIHTLQLAVYMHESGEGKLAQDCMDAVFSAKPVSMTVRRFMGEALGEHHNHPRQTGNRFLYGVPQQPQDRNLIDRALNIYRGRFQATAADIWSSLVQASDNDALMRIMESARQAPAQKGGYGLHSLIRILAEVRQILAGVNLSELDLGNCQLNGTVLSQNGLCAKLDGAKLSADNLFLSGHRGTITSVTFSPDGKTILSASEDGTAKLWDAATAELLHTFDCGDRVYLAGFVHDGSRIITVTKRNGLMAKASEVSVGLWDARSFRFVEENVLTATTSRAVLSPGGDYLLLDSRQQCCVVSTDTLEILCRRKVDYRNIYSILYGEFLSDEQWVLIFSGGSVGCNFQVIDILSDEVLHAGTHPQGIRCVSFHPNAPEAAIAEGEMLQERYGIVNSEDGSLITELDLHDLTTVSSKTICYSGNGKWLSIGMQDHLRLYRTEDYGLAYTFENAGSPSAFNAPCSKIVLTGGSNDLRLYALDHFECLLSMQGTAKLRPTAAISPSGEWIATCSGDKMLRLWSTKQLKLVAQTALWGTDVSFSPSGERLIVHSQGFDVELSLPGLQVIAKHPHPVNQQNSPDGKYYAVHKDDRAYLYNAAQQLLFVTDPIEDVIFGTDHILVRDALDTLTIYELPSGALCKVLPDCRSAAINADHVVALHEDGNLLVWPLRHPLGLCLDFGIQENCMELRFSPDGKYLVQIGMDRIIIRETVHFEILHQRQLEKIQSVVITEQTIAVTYPDPSAAGALTVTVFRLENMEECCAITVSCESSRFRYTPVLVSNDHAMVLQVEEDTLQYVRFGTAGVETTGSITLAPGLEVKGLDMHRLHRDSAFTDAQRRILRQYGAKI